MCNASTDYADIYYSQNPTLGATQSGAGKKRRISTKKVQKKKSTTKVGKKKSTSTKVIKKKSTSAKGKKRSMRGGASESSFQLDDQFIRDNLGISFETVGGATYMPSEYYKAGILDSLRTGTMAGYDPLADKLAPFTVTGGKKKRVTKSKVGKKKTVKKSTKKGVKKVSKKKTSKKVVASSWKFW